jgi:riboflavin synthase
MFTGIIEASGQVVEMRPKPDGGSRLKIGTSLAPEVAEGASLAVNGCCLTAVDSDRETVSFDLLEETLRRTSLGSLRKGRFVNLERPLAAAGRFDGHLVQGHIDTSAAIAAIEALGDDHLVEIDLPEEFARYVAFKGSIAVDGISLTVAELRSRTFVLWIIPHTWRVTNLHQRQPGDLVNLEFDIVAKYVERMMGSKQ